ncbi:gluconokinase [Dyella monticola]|uniref:Gluconokinase n=1 Tax=Dyella monticola TaxID=1927958 RepID=A0A370WT81_9GAMM|nr:gluconokinase [Dyella monticola]RDS79323.1 gluconokinase [Dyella monticola]
MTSNTHAIAIMGVSSCGKSTVAAAISQRTSASLIEGDDFHPPENIRKMSAGIPLTDDDRHGWLERLAQEVSHRLSQSERVVFTCSALKHRYRDTLRRAIPDLGFAFLELTPAQATERAQHRTGHFMPASLIGSQFHDLQSPEGEPQVLTVDATKSVEAITDEVIAWWHGMQ